MSENNNQNLNSGHFTNGNGTNGTDYNQNNHINGESGYIPMNLPISSLETKADDSKHNNHIEQTHSHTLHSEHKDIYPDHTSHNDHTFLDSVSNESEEKTNGFGSKMLKVLMIIGILVLLFFISIGIVKIVPKAIGSLSSASVYISSIFSREGIEVTADKEEVKNDEVLMISWKNTSKKDGVYTWSFKCIEGVTVLYKSGNGSMQPVFCETSFPLPENTNSFPFVIKTENEKEEDMLMTLSLFNKETKEILFTDSAEITVLGKSAPVKEEVKKPEETSSNPTYNPSNTPANGNITPTDTKPTQPQNTNAIETTSTNRPVTQTVASIGPTDMSINLLTATAIQSGTINITSLSNVGPNDKIVVRFKIANLGKNSTGNWQITALLPTLIASDRAFVSKVQPSLAPTESHEMTLMFDSFDATKNEIVITIENVNDTNSLNNIIRIPISGSRNTNDGAYSGNRPDLEVKIIGVGTIDRYNNFYATNNLDIDDQIAVKFQVQNIGGSTSGYYDMRVKVPTEDNSDTRTFRYLSPLAPGVRTEFTVNFDNPDEGRNIISIELDPDNDIRENKETNNKDSRTVNIDN